MNEPPLVSADVSQSMGNSAEAEQKAMDLHNSLAVKLHKTINIEDTKTLLQNLKTVMAEGEMQRCDDTMDVFNWLQRTGNITVGHYDLLIKALGGETPLGKMVKDTEKAIKHVRNTQGTENRMEQGGREDTARVAEEQGESGPEDVPLYLPRYEMEADTRGKCLIISNWSFAAKMKDLPGYKIDAGKLATVFRVLKFDIVLRNNLSNKKMEEEVRKISKEDHGSFDCFVCCILSHGDTDVLYGTNGKETPVARITSMFEADQCPSLKGKPKLFFFQACRGSDKEEEPKVVAADVNIESIPNGADFFTGYSTIQGYVCYVLKDSGSIYITSLIKILTEYADRCDLLTMMTLVNDEVAKEKIPFEKEKDFKQMSCQWSTLRKLVFMFPSELPQ